jgi:carbon-monoxide dehydrogenase medium subunit
VVAVAWAARKTGRPVRWAETRSENIDGTSPAADNNGSAAYRQHLARVLVRRALEEAASR